MLALMEDHGRQRIRVLVVDDNHDLADSTAEVLRVLDYDVRTVYTGQEAVAVAGQYRPDIVVLDINMPGMDGLQTARHLKRDRRLARKSFLAHTGTDEPLVRQVASQIGFNGWVVKGGPMSALIDALLEICEEPRDCR